MLDAVAPLQSAWARIGLAVALALAPTVCFLVGYRALGRVRHDALAERMIDVGYEHPGVDEFVDQLRW